MLRGGGKRDEQRSAEVLEIRPAGGYNHIDTVTVSDGVAGAGNTQTLEPSNHIEHQYGAKRGLSREENETRQEKHAALYYEEIRRRKPYADAHHIAKAAPRFSVEQIETIRQHVFIKEQPRNGGIKRFDCDYYISQAWQRLVEGKNVQASDIVLLQHEYYELTIMAETGCVYEIAHELANRKYNWATALNLKQEE